MDTPDRNKINTSLSDLEKSPVYRYINNLSPLKPIKPVHIPQTFNSIGCSSPPYVFTFVQRHDDPVETKKRRLSYEDVIRSCSGEEALADSTHANSNSTELQDNAHQGISVGDASIIIDLTGDDTKFSFGQPQGSDYYFGCPVDYPPLLGDDEANSLLPLPGEAASDVANVSKGCETNSVEGEQAHRQGMCQMEPKSEGQEDDWDSVIPDATTLLSFNHSQMEDSGQQVVDYMSVVTQSLVNDGRGVIDSALSHFEQIAAYKDHMQDNTNVVLMTGNTNEEVDNELIPVMHRSTRRRCLNFEIANAQRKSSDDNPNTGIITEEKRVVNERQLLPAQHQSNLQRCNIPGIGLHLNEIGSTLPLQNSAIKDYHHHHPLMSVPSERGVEQSNNGAQPGEDFFQPCCEDFNLISPGRKRKRCKLEPAELTEGCKRCNCKNSKCLKLYCECFAAGVYCSAPCSCMNCFNLPIHEATVLQARKQILTRNPYAFAPKVIRSSDSADEIGDDPNKTPAPARHKRGCSCKKSSCSKKYCECYQSGVGCSTTCRCEECKNTYGRKDGSAPTGPEDDTRVPHHLKRVQRM